jgi:hypothetical protein
MWMLILRPASRSTVTRSDVTRWQGDKPRPHHYDFAHRAVPGIALDPRVDLAALSREDRLDAALQATWAAVGDRRDAAERLPDEGLTGELVEVAGQSAVLVTFPVAIHAAEAFYALVAPLEPPESRRYLTLEFSWDVVTSNPTTVIGEWRAGGHVNLGLGPEAAASAFLARMEVLLSATHRT